jgi:hypothetical protein
MPSGWVGETDLERGRVPQVLEDARLPDALEQRRSLEAVLRKRRADAEREAAAAGALTDELRPAARRGALLLDVAAAFRRADPACALTVQAAAALVAPGAGAGAGARRFGRAEVAAGARALARAVQSRHRAALGVLLVVAAALDAGELPPAAWCLFLSVNDGAPAQPRPPGSDDGRAAHGMRSVCRSWRLRAS